MIGHVINFTNLISITTVVALSLLFSEYTVSTLKYLTTNGLNYLFAFLPYQQFAPIENSILSNVRSMKSIAEISQKYDTQFVPSKITFSIWIPIYFSLVLFGILSLLTNKEEKERIGKSIGPMLFLTNLLSISWMVAFSLEYLFISHLIIVGLWWSLFTLYSTIIDVRYGYSVSKYPLWVKLPFSMYLAWITVASVASAMMILKHDIMKPFIDSFSNATGNTTEKLFVYNIDFTRPVLAVVSMVGVVTNMLDEQQWCATFITLTTIVGLWFSKFRRDSVFVMVLLWAILGIVVKNNTSGDGVGGGGLKSLSNSLVGVVSLVNAVVLFFEFVFSLYHVVKYPGHKLLLTTTELLEKQAGSSTSGKLNIDFKGNQPPPTSTTAAQQYKKNK